MKYMMLVCVDGASFEADGEVLVSDGPFGRIEVRAFWPG